MPTVRIRRPAGRGIRCPSKKFPKQLRSSIKTSQSVFLVETSSQGIFAVRFPVSRRGPASRAGLSPLLRKLRHTKLDLTGYSDFEKRVYRALLRVPAGKVVSYGELAKRAGFPGAARAVPIPINRSEAEIGAVQTIFKEKKWRVWAVGTAMRKNRLPVAIPCHRVIRGDGRLGQYSQGISWKRELLEHEGFRL